MEEGSLDMLDHSDFQETDIPFEIPLPEKAFLTVSILSSFLQIFLFEMLLQKSPEDYIRKQMMICQEMLSSLLSSCYGHFSVINVSHS